jgi:uncharacterized protein YbaA (DUF1428 family)
VEETLGAKMKYVDGYILPVPRKHLGEYRKMAQGAGKIWKKHGALKYFECVGDDLKSKWSNIKFPKTVKAKAGEKVIFSFVVFKSKKHRNMVNKRVMKDPYMNNPEWKDKTMPFDMKRMVYGGFKAIVEK